MGFLVMCAAIGLAALAAAGRRAGSRAAGDGGLRAEPALLRVVARAGRRSGRAGRW
jgi:hypothetical protein